MRTEIPAEIWERIIDQLETDLYTIAKCAQVCKAWYHRSQYRLVSRIMLGDPSRTRRFARLLDTQPRIRKWVDEVRIHGMARSPKELPPIQHFNTFTSMLAKKLPSMYRLTIAASEWQSGTAHRNAFLHLSTFTGVTDLYLMDVMFPSKVVFARLFCALPSLSKITCIEVSFRSTQSNPAVFSPTRPEIRTVHLEGPSLDVADVFAEKLGLPVEHFSAGWFITLKDSPCDNAILAMVQCTGSTLRRVDIRLRRELPETTAKVDPSGREPQTGAAYWPLELNRCSLLEIFQFCYCPPSLSQPTKSVQGIHLQSHCLRDIVVGLQATEVRILVFSLDFRHLGDDSNSPFIIEFAQQFLDQHQCAAIDATLTNNDNFKKLKYVGFFLVCGLGATAGARESWSTAAMARFPQLHARRLLQAQIVGSL